MANKNVSVGISVNMAAFRSSMQQAQKEFARFGKKMSSLGRQMTQQLSLPGLAIGGLSVKAFADFQLQMAKVQAVSGATAAEFKRLEESAKLLGRTTVFTATQVAELQTEYAKLGFTADEIMKAQKATLALAQATDTDLAQAAEVGGATLRGFGLEASQMGHVTDVMAKSFSRSALDINTFQDSMKYVAPVAAAAGISIEEASAMLSVLANSGIKGSQAGTSLRRIMSELVGTGGNLEDKLAVLAEKGLNLADAKDEVGRHAQTSLIVLTNMLETLPKLTEEYVNSDGAAQGMADTMNDTAVGSLKALQSASEGALIMIGDLLMEGLRPLMDFLTDSITAFTNASSGTKAFILAIGGLVTIAGPVVWAIGSIGSAIATMQAAILATNPVLLVFAGAAAAIAGIAMANSDALQSQNEQLMAEKGHVKTLIGIIGNENVARDVRLKAIKEYNENYGELNGHLLTEASNAAELANAYNAAADAIDRKIRMQVNEEKLVELNKKAVEQFKEMEEMAARLVTAKRLVARGHGREDGMSYAAAHQIVTNWDEMDAKRQAAYQETLEQIADLQGANMELSGSYQTVAHEVEEVTTVTEESTEATKKQKTEMEKYLDELAYAKAVLENYKQQQIESTLSAGKFNYELVDLGRNVEEATNLFSEGFVGALESTSDQLFFLDEDVQNFLGSVKEIKKGVKQVEQGFDGANMVVDLFGNLLQESFSASLENGKSFFSVFLDGLKKVIVRLLVAAAAAAALAAAITIAFGGMNIKGATGQITKVAGADLFKNIFANMAGIPQFADGGIVSGTTLAMVGEYPGAKSNPEVIAPLSKLKSMIDSGGSSNVNVNVSGRLSGQDILLSGERASTRRSRFRK